MTGSKDFKKQIQQKRDRICLVSFRSLSQVSAVCAYSVSAIRDIFNEGKFKTPVAVETSHVKWVMYTGEVPVPRPGAVSLLTSQPEVILDINKCTKQTSALF